MQQLKMKAAAAAWILALPMGAMAESQIVTSTGSASAKLDFQITIPKVLYLRIGTGTDAAANAVVDKIDFAPTAAQIAAGTPVAGTGGDLINGVVTASLIGNFGDITLTATPTAASLTNASGDSIPYSEISVASAARTSATPLTSPPLSNAATTLSVSAVNKVVKQDGKWTFAYKNSAPVPSGTYGGVNLNGSRVTYSASIP